MCVMSFRWVGPFWLPSAWLRDDWLISSLTAKLFFLSTFCVLAVTPAVMGIDTTKLTFWIRFPLTALGFLVPVGVLFLFVGMWRYWMRVDHSRPWIKRIWFFILLVGFWWGSFLYYFAVYLPQLVRRRKLEA